mmetsp:Transcript_39811/g.79580  ORF Transcript_39811/g.79580 Transcript_39811/m.79580 type:complete len:183 (+) Transcript_39811:78-626(+)
MENGSSSNPVNWLNQWVGLESTVRTWFERGWKRAPPEGGGCLPTAEDVVNVIFCKQPIEWTRLTVYQDVSMRLVAEALLRKCPGEVPQPIYVQDEVEHIKVEIPRLSKGQQFHLYVRCRRRGLKRRSHVVSSFSFRRPPISQSSHLLSSASHSIFTVPVSLAIPVPVLSAPCSSMCPLLLFG